VHINGNTCLSALNFVSVCCINLSRMFLLSAKKIFCIAIIILHLKEFNCACKQSYAVICDSLEDLKTQNKKDVSSWTELIVGNGSVQAKPLTIFNMYDIIPFKKLVSLTIVSQIDQISPLFGYCNFDYNLQLLTFYKNNITTLQKRSIPKLKLKKISFVDNNIETIEDGFIDAGAEIDIVDMSNNKIEAIENSVFVFNDKSQVTNTLTLRNNKISYIQVESLPKALEILNLDNNQLREIPVEVFNKMRNLQELTLSHNHLYTIPDISQMTKLKLVDFSYNGITSVSKTTFRNQTRLHFVDLSNNKISKASFADFSFLARRGRPLLISIGFNRLVGFSFDNVTKASNFDSLEVFWYGNPFDCNEFTSMQKSLIRLKIRQNECDLKFQNQGLTPYCLNYHSIFYLDVSKTVNEFLTSIDKNKKLISCDLVPANYLGSPELTCIA
jgi:Leucine-rich repeat (LRR) protein